MTNKTFFYPGSLMLLFVLCSLPELLPAQTEPFKPYAGEQEVTSKLFNLDEQDINYHFTAELPGGNFVIIEWSHLSDWNNKADLQHITDLAKTYEVQIEDSFKAGTTAKRLDIHVPIAGEPVTVMFSEHNTGNNVLLMNGDEDSPVPLKVNMDTIRVLKTLGEEVIKALKDDKVRKEHKPVQMQYTFLLKDIDHIKDMDNDKAAIADAGDKFDSVVNRYRHKWAKQDKWSHDLNVSYFPLNEDAKKRLTVERPDYPVDKEGLYHRPFDEDFEVGAALFRNTVCPLFEIGWQYKWPANRSVYNFVRISGTGISLITEPNRADYKANEITFANFECGSVLSRSYTLIPFTCFSLGFGFGATTFHDPSLPEVVGRAFFKYRVSKLFMISLDDYYLSITQGTFYSISGTIRLL